MIVFNTIYPLNNKIEPEKSNEITDIVLERFDNSTILFMLRHPNSIRSLVDSIKEGENKQIFNLKKRKVV